MSTDTDTPTASVADSPAPRRGRGAKLPAGPKIYAASALLKNASDPTRLRILLILGEKGELHVGALCVQVDQTQPAVSRHLALLRYADVIAPRRQGKNNFYALTAKGAALVAAVRGLMG
jgi:DNA-binding transcriptional ArsR family regulator